MNEWLVTSDLAISIAEERTRARRPEIVLERFSLLRALRPVVRALLAFLF